MVGLLALGKAVTIGRHGWGQEGLCAEIKWRGGAGSGSRRGGELRGETQASCRLETGALIKGGGCTPGSRLR